MPRAPPTNISCTVTLLTFANFRLQKLAVANDPVGVEAEPEAFAAERPRVDAYAVLSAHQTDALRGTAGPCAGNERARDEREPYDCPPHCPLPCLCVVKHSTEPTRAQGGSEGIERGRARSPGASLPAPDTSGRHSAHQRHAGTRGAHNAGIASRRRERTKRRYARRIACSAHRAACARSNRPTRAIAGARIVRESIFLRAFVR